VWKRFSGTVLKLTLVAETTKTQMPPIPFRSESTKMYRRKWFHPFREPSCDAALDFVGIRNIQSPATKEAAH
jgi:hypothetical protein